MEAPENFKLDVRVRERMLAKGTITEADVKKHLDALPDRDADLEVVDVVQPAVMPPGERPPVSARPAPRPAPVPVAAPLSAPMSVPPPPLAVDAGWGDDDEADDDEEDDDEDDDDESDEGEAEGEGGAGEGGAGGGGAGEGGTGEGAPE